jgi:MFS transporter, PAT family, beta-lactamase induction signal transducer AmpG
VNRLGRRPALILFAVLQLITVAGYAVIARGKPELDALYAICAAEHLGSGMATAALFTCMMDWCEPETSATDYTVQACAVVIATGLASALSGFSAGALGYFGHFCVATAVALGSVVAALWLFPRSPPARLTPSGGSSGASPPRTADRQS